MLRSVVAAVSIGVAALSLAACDGDDGPTADPTVSASPSPQAVDARPLTTQLFDAIQEGDADYLKLVLDEGADVNAVHSSGNTAMSVAITNRQTDMVRTLVRAGIAVPSPHPDINYLALAATYAGGDTVRILVTNGADPDGRYPDDFAFEVPTIVNVTTTITPSPQPSESPGPLRVEVSPSIAVVPTVGDEDEVDRDQWVGVPMLNAARVGNIGAVQALVDAGADVELPVGELGEVPLTVAAEAGHYDLVQYLVELGADPDYALADESSARDLAAARGHAEIVAYFDLLAGAAPAADTDA